MEGRRERESEACRLRVRTTYLEAGTRTRVLVPQRLNVLVFHSYCHGLSHRASHGPAQLRPPCAGRSDVMSLSAQASVSLVTSTAGMNRLRILSFTLAAIALRCLARLMTRQDPPLRPSTRQGSTRGTRPWLIWAPVRNCSSPC